MALLTIFLVLYVVTAVSLILGLLVNGVRPSKTLAWLLAIFTIPVGGILLYLLLGRNRRKNKILKKKDVSFNGTTATFQQIPQEIDMEQQRIINLVGKNCGFYPVKGNRAILLKDGKTTFESIFQALENANSYIYLQYYIFEEGDLADRLLQLFQSKVKKGLKVRMIYDSVGSFTLSKKYIKALKAAGVEVFPFLPFRFDRFLSALNYRNHRKIIVVDGIHGFTGGINISDKYLKGDPDLGIWHDMHLQITGPAVGQLEEVFLSDWFLVSEEQLYLGKPEKFDFVNPEDSVPIQIVSSGPEDDFATIQQVYFSMITSAKKYLYITNPYVMPGPEILHALQTASLSGVDVRLLVSERGDNTIVDWSIRSYFEPLLRAGVRLFLFPDGFLHSKIIVSDDTLATVGTANIDMRSFEHNYEVNALVYDKGFAQKLKKDFLNDCLNSIELDYNQFKQRTWVTKLKEGTAKVFSPIL